MKNDLLNELNVESDIYVVSAVVKQELVKNAIKSLNKALDLNIKEYVTVNFDAVVDSVDALGGINMDITSAEVKYINTYIDNHY